MDYAYYKKFINTRTKGRTGVTPPFTKPKASHQLITDLFTPLGARKPTKWSASTPLASSWAQPFRQNIG